MVVPRSGAAARLCAGQCRVGAHHCLPLRGRARNADLDHRGDGPGRAERDPVPRTPKRSKSCARSIRWWWTRPARSPWAGPSSSTSSWMESTSARHCSSSRASSGRASIRSRRPSCAAAESRKLALQPVENFRSITGQAVEGVVAGRKVAVGSARAMEAFSGVPKALAGAADALRAQGKGAMFAAIDGRVAALIAVADPVKETTPDAVRLLKDAGHPPGHALGRRAQDRRSGGAPARHRRSRGRGPARAEGGEDQGAASVAGTSWRWRATASTTRRRSPRRTSASRWAPAPTSPSKAPP